MFLLFSAAGDLLALVIIKDVTALKSISILRGFQGHENGFFAS